MNEPALLNIVGFRTSKYFDRKHYKHWGRDLSGVTTDDQYLDLARRVAEQAARRLPGTQVDRRGNNDLIVYAKTSLTKQYSNNCDSGIFLIVHDQGSQGLLVTLFAPDEGAAYYDNPDQRLLL